MYQTRDQYRCCVAHMLIGADTSLLRRACYREAIERYRESLAVVSSVDILKMEMEMEIPSSGDVKYLLASLPELPLSVGLIISEMEETFIGGGGSSLELS
ncbi:hypothetical protein Tco_1134667 [Tanacetum coccineum]